MVIAPAWALFGDPVLGVPRRPGNQRARDVAGGGARVPACTPVRSQRRAALLVALFTVLVPSMSYTGVLMTENAFYPVFLLAVLLIARTVRRAERGQSGTGPARPRRRCIHTHPGRGAGRGVRRCFASVRPEGGSVRTSAVSRARQPDPRARRARLASPHPSPSITAGDGPFGWLGGQIGDVRPVPPRGDSRVVRVSGGRHCAVRRGDSSGGDGGDDHPSGPVPPSVGTARDSSRRWRFRTLLAMLISVSLVSASLDVDGVENLNERYVFYVVPLTFVGLALWVNTRLPRPRPLLVGRRRSVLRPRGGDSVRTSRAQRELPVDRVDAVDRPFVRGACTPRPSSRRSSWDAAFSGSGRIARAFGGCGLSPGVTMTLLALLAIGGNAASASHSAQTFQGGSATWIDDALPAGESASVLRREHLAASRRLDPFAPWLMIAEFFNSAVGDVYRLGGPTYYEDFLPTKPIAEPVRRDAGGERQAASGSVRARHLSDAGRRHGRRPIAARCARAREDRQSRFGLRRAVTARPTRERCAECRGTRPTRSGRRLIPARRTRNRRGAKRSAPRSRIGMREPVMSRSLQITCFAVVPLVSLILLLATFSDQQRVGLDFTTAYMQAGLVVDGLNPYASPDASFRSAAVSSCKDDCEHDEHAPDPQTGTCGDSGARQSPGCQRQEPDGRQP